MRGTMDYCLCCTIKGWWLFSQWPLTLRDPLGLHQTSLLCTSKHELTVSPIWEESPIEKMWPLERYLSPRKMSKLRLQKMRNIKGADLKMFSSNTAHLERSWYAIHLWIGRDWYGNGFLAILFQTIKICEGMYGIDVEQSVLDCAVQRINNTVSA